MFLKGLRFTLDVDSQRPETFAVVNYLLKQRQSFPFMLVMDVASHPFWKTVANLLEKNATLTIWQGDALQHDVSGIVTRFAGRSDSETTSETSTRKMKQL